jgi:DNA repair ATPase RecN
MTLEEMDKKIEFILQMQAQFEANLGNLRVTVADLAGVVGESIKLSDDRFTRHDERMKDLITAQKATGEQIKDLAAAQKATDERLNALINIMERHITGPNHPAQL